MIKHLYSFTSYMVILIAICLFSLPLVSLTLLSFRPAAISCQPELIFCPSLENYESIFQSKFSYCLLNSFLVAGITTVLTLIVSALAAYSLSRFRFRGRNSMHVLTFSLRTIPPISFVLPLFFVWTSTGLYDTYWGLALAMTALRLTLGVLMLKAFFDGIPAEIEEAAMVDGCTRLGALRRVILPLAAPGLAVVAIFSFIFTWNDLATALILTGRAVKTVPVFLAGMRGQYGINWGNLAAGCITYIIPVLIVAFLLQKHIVRGLTFGAVKG